MAVPKEKWREVSAYASRFFPDPGLGFIDYHAALAHAMAGDGDALAKIVSNPKGPAATWCATWPKRSGPLPARTG